MLKLKLMNLKLKFIKLKLINLKLRLKLLILKLKLIKLKLNIIKLKLNLIKVKLRLNFGPKFWLKSKLKLKLNSVVKFISKSFPKLSKKQDYCQSKVMKLRISHSEFYLLSLLVQLYSWNRQSFIPLANIFVILNRFMITRFL